MANRMEVRMGTVPGFKHDVFVSFSWADNKERLPGEPRSRWIDTLKEALTARLADRMRPDPVSVWLDAKDVEGNLPLDEILRGAAGHSALFLLVLSENYLQSRYCRDELEAFLRQAGGDESAKGRIFVVLRECAAVGKPSQVDTEPRRLSVLSAAPGDRGD